MSDDKPEPFCNLCGLTCRLRHDAPYEEDGGMINATVMGGMSSTPGNGDGTLDDMEGYRFSLCEFCLDWLFAQFRVPVATFDPRRGLTRREGETLDEAMVRTGGCVFLMAGPDPGPWEPAAVRVERDEWRKEKREFFDEKARRDAARKIKAP